MADCQITIDILIDDSVFELIDCFKEMSDLCSEFRVHERDKVAEKFSNLMEKLII